MTVSTEFLVIIGGLFLLIIVILNIWLIKSALQKVSTNYVSQNSFKEVSDMQKELFGAMHNLSENQTVTHSQILSHIESRMGNVQKSIFDTLNTSSTNTAKVLGELQHRLVSIDKAQSNLEKLSGDVLSLQDILSNKQTRGAFGEIQLNDIVLKALPADSYTFQATLKNGKRVDCLIHLPNPPGPIAVDSKFPLEAFELLRKSTNQIEKTKAEQNFRFSVRAHIKDISEKYILEDQTAEGALMFLPSEAVYAELHSNFSEVVREGFDARVWIVSPTTCMATLNTMRAVLKDARMREQAGKIRSELSFLYSDVQRLETRVNNLDRHFTMASKDLEEVKISAHKAGGRALRLDRFEFAEENQETVEVFRKKPVNLKR